MRHRQNRRLAAVGVLVAAAMIAIACTNLETPAREDVLKEKITLRMNANSTVCELKPADKPKRTKSKKSDDVVMWEIHNLCTTTQKVGLTNLTYKGIVTDENDEDSPCKARDDPSQPPAFDETSLPLITVPEGEKRRVMRAVHPHVTNKGCWTYSISLGGAVVDPEFVIWR